MSARGDIRSGLIPAVLAVGSNLGRLLEHEEMVWSSPTFTGARHTIVLEFKGEREVQAGVRFAARLPTHEFMLAGHKVCEAKIIRSHFGMLPHKRLEIEAEIAMVEDARLMRPTASLLEDCT